MARGPETSFYFALFVKSPALAHAVNYPLAESALVDIADALVARPGVMSVNYTLSIRVSLRKYHHVRG